MKTPPAILVSLAAAKRDPALQSRGDRKLLVTRLYPDVERPITQTLWYPPAAAGEKCSVQQMPDTEVATFNHLARQTRHYHRLGTEIYLVLEGRMRIEVEGQVYTLDAGDTLIVNPGAYHEVERSGEFLCRVIAVNCHGADDRYE